MDIRQKLGENLRQEHDKKGWSQEELAHEADIHRTYISDLERGARNPTVMVVEKISKALDVSMGMLLD